MLPYILSKIIPKSSESKRLADIAEKQAEALSQFAIANQEREKTAQTLAIQETKRLFILAEILKNDKDGLRDNLNEAREIGSIVGKYANGPARISVSDGTADFVASELAAEVEREEMIEQVEPELNRIDPNTEDKLIDRVIPGLTRFDRWPNRVSRWT